MGLGQTDPVSGPIQGYKRGRIGGGTMLSECQKSARISVFLEFGLGIYATSDLSAIKNILILLKNRIEMVKNDQFKFLSRRVISWPDQMVKSDSARIKITKYNKCCIQNQDALGLGLGWWVIFYFRAFFGEADFALAFRFLAFSASNSFFWAEKLVWYDGTNLKQSQKMIFVQQLAN